ncbi:MAG: hypothetical protein QXS29_10025 [Nitrososphaeria archaeon]
MSRWNKKIFYRGFGKRAFLERGAIFRKRLKDKIKSLPERNKREVLGWGGVAYGGKW